MNNVVKTINIEAGMPSVEDARKRLLKEIKDANKSGTKVLIIIHGYGSTGVGGKLRIDLRKSLNYRKKEGLIRLFVPGENWSIFDEDSRCVIENCHAISNDSNLEKGNQGVTIILLP